MPVEVPLMWTVERSLSDETRKLRLAVEGMKPTDAVYADVVPAELAPEPRHETRRSVSDRLRDMLNA